MFDAHCHLDRCGDPQAVLDRAYAAGVTDLLVAGVDPDGWTAQQALGGPGVWHALGLHPWAVAGSTDDAVDRDLTRLEAAIREASPVALGELGLDRGRRCPPDSLPRQERAFRAQLRLAHTLNLPVVLHIVRAHDLALGILREEGMPEPGGMVHSYSGSAEQVKPYVDLGLHISFCGTIVDSNAHRVRTALAATPPDRLLLETDAPDQTPVSRRPAHNEPAFLIDVIAAAAEVRGESIQELTQRCTHNARNLFRLPESAP